MEWYEIILGIIFWGIGIFIGIKFQIFQKGKYKNDSWNSR